MLCDDCGIWPANLIWQDDTSTPPRVQNLCLACSTRQLSQHLGTTPVGRTLGRLILKSAAGLGAKAAPAPESAAETPPHCEGCGLTLTEFQRLGRVGCAACYPAFAAELALRLPVPPRSAVRPGRRPQVSAPAPPADNAAREALLHELQQAVAEEAFERAAELRDALRQLH